MKFGNNVITYNWDDNGNPKGFRDRLCKILNDRRKIIVHDSWIIEENGSNKPVGAVYLISGRKRLVDFLAWLTNFTLNPGGVVELRTDENGKFTSCEEISS